MSDELDPTIAALLAEASASEPEEIVDVEDFTGGSFGMSDDFSFDEPKPETK